jgi:hypothetical protein
MTVRIQVVNRAVTQVDTQGGVTTTQSAVIALDMTDTLSVSVMSAMTVTTRPHVEIDRRNGTPRRIVINRQPHLLIPRPKSIIPVVQLQTPRKHAWQWITDRSETTEW